MTHKFDTDIAKEVGLLGAVLYDNIEWWCMKNKSSNINEHDGNFWTYNSNRGWSELFDYATVNQIKLALKKLEDAGLIVSGTYNKVPYDRTKWYRPKNLSHQTEKSNETDRKAQPIPSINTDNKPDIGNPTEKQILEIGEKLKYDAKSCMRFYNHYSSMGWKKGRTNITDFVPLLRNWMMNEKPEPKKRKFTPSSELKVI